MESVLCQDLGYWGGFVLMAQIATLIEVVPDDAPSTGLPQISMRNLTVAYPGEEIAPGWTTLIGNRFPFAPSAVGFLARYYDIEYPPIVMGGIKAPYVIRGAIDVESSYIESNRGQIWPRIG
jgi:hypothetical protein